MQASCSIHLKIATRTALVRLEWVSRRRDSFSNVNRVLTITATPLFITALCIYALISGNTRI